MSEMQAPEEKATVPTRPITVAEYHRMGQLGIIGPDERVELLDGELIQMLPIGPEHAYVVDRLAEWLSVRFTGRAAIRVQNPIALDKRSEPQPDIMICELPAEQYAKAHPNPSQVLLIVEVSDSKLSHDRGKKLHTYARRRLFEYWVVDVVHGRIEVHRNPRGERYLEHRIVRRGDAIAPSAFPDDAIPVNAFLPPLG